jgi:hypothetical protein
MSEIEEGEIVQDKEELEKEKERKNKVNFYLINHYNFIYLGRRKKKRKKSFKR